MQSNWSGVRIVGANYIEANESLSKKDFMMRIKICRKESKECVYFIRLIRETNNWPMTRKGFGYRMKPVS